ncbi:MAG: hypothetical protein J6T44_05975 [Prevotella sp.]|nr:hypothetical protein [Prevotella sp.]
MKRVFAHLMRIFRKFWFFLLIISPISPIFTFGVIIIMTVISLLCFDDPVDVESAVEDILNNFSEEELEIIFAEKMDKNVSDDKYLALVARYQSYVCPKKLDAITTWVGSESKKDAYIYNYELNDRKFDSFDVDVQKQHILPSINKDSIQTSRVINSGRGIIFSYTYKNSGETKDVVFTNEELKSL